MTNNHWTAANLLNQHWLPEYMKQRDSLATQLRELNTAMFILEKIELFPFWLFTPNTHDYVFWRTIKFSLVQTAVIIASRVIVEGDSDALTLKGFKTGIVRNAVDQSAEQMIRDRLRTISFDKRIAAIEEKIRAIRNNFVAHLDKTQNTLELSQRTIADMTYAEMKELLDGGYELFNALSFEAYYVPWFAEYSDQIRNAQQTDVERLLDQVAKSSFLLNLPETQPEAWQRRRSKLSSEEIELLNHYRRKFGLPIV